MHNITCDGCGTVEPKGTPKDQSKIKPVKLTIMHDERESMPQGQHRLESDLCDDCEGHMLHKYFGVRAEGKLEVPAFLEPTTREREIRLAAQQ